MPENELTVKELFEFVKRDKPKGYGRQRLTLHEDGSGKIDAGHGTVVALSWYDFDELVEKMSGRKRERAVQRVLKATEEFARHVAHIEIQAKCEVCSEVRAAHYALGACDD